MTAKEARELAEKIEFTPNETEALQKIMDDIKKAVQFKKFQTYCSIPWGCTQKVYNKLEEQGYTIEHASIQLLIKW